KLWIEAGLPSQESETIAAKTQEETARFEKQALPIFKAKCFSCHGTDQPAAKLDLRSLLGVLKGSEAGPVVSERGSDKSLLIRRVSARQMPPPGSAEPLTESEVNALAKWIDTSDFGLLQPRVERTTFNAAEAPPITDADHKFWAFRKPVAVPIPVVK